jgi:hypothetical protein
MRIGSVFKENVWRLFVINYTHYINKATLYPIKNYAGHISEELLDILVTEVETNLSIYYKECENKG